MSLLFFSHLIPKNLSFNIVNNNIKCDFQPKNALK